jgi:hypothetical protein
VNTRKLYRAAYQLDRARRATKNPAHFVKNRVKAKALGSVGFFGLMSRFWRA